MVRVPLPLVMGRQAGTWNLLTQRQKDSPVWGSDHRQANNITVQSSCGASWNVEWPEDWEICQAEISGLLFHQMQNLFTSHESFSSQENNCILSHGEEEQTVEPLPPPHMNS
ncbi:uncharacterized protein LOC135648491 [Musa acuminata AAA Group]|uniref:uncharacterized protein LOC135648491 n=1 Tax=Musa acuminata AAA Group TaxID=214697 RepID=UPI0031E3201F